MYKKFEPGTVLYSLTETHPKVEFFVNSGSVGSVYYNKLKQPTGSLVGSGYVGLGNPLNTEFRQTFQIPGNYYLWLSARDLNGNGDSNTGYTDGDRISLWEPVSGTYAPTASFIQGAASNERPYYVENEFNGLPGVQFLAAQEVESEDIAIWKRFHTGSWTMFVVMKHYGQDPETSQWIITNEEGNISGRRGFGFSTRKITNDVASPGAAFNTDRSLYTYVLNSSNQEYFNILSPTGSFEYNEIMLVKIKMDFDIGSGSLYKDGQLLATSGSAGSTYVLNPSVYTLTIGGRARNDQSYFSGSIGDIILFDYITTDEQDNQIEGYLEQIYGDFTTI